MDASCRWHQGAPPPGWWQASNGRWHPPSHDDPTDELRTVAVGGAHLAGRGRGANLWQTYRSWPRWARLAGPIAAFLLVVGVLGAAAAGTLREDGRETAATAPATTAARTETPATMPKAVTPAPGADVTTTTSAAPRSTAPPEPAPTTPTTLAAEPAPRPPTTAAPTTNDIQPGAPCSPEGAEAVTADGMALVCTTQKCHGAPFADPRWWRASC
jgi:hypothetical protein